MKIAIVEHTHSAVTTPNTHLGAGTTQPQSLNLGPIRLAGAMVKTAYTRSPPTHLIEWLTWLEYLAKTYRLVATKPFRKFGRLRHQNLRLNDANFAGTTIRDYRRGSVIGELGEGVSILFAQDYLHYPCVSDFKGAFPTVKGEHPDFLCFNGQDSILLESKAGLAMTSIKAPLRHGLDQCDQGLQHLMNATSPVIPRKSYCSMAAFELKTSNHDTTLHFVDPETPASSMDRASSIRLLHHYYSSAIEGLGGTGLIEIEHGHTLEGFGDRKFVRAQLRDRMQANMEIRVDHQMYQAVKDERPDDYATAHKNWLEVASDHFGNENTGEVVWGDGIVVMVHRHVLTSLRSAMRSIAD